MRITIDEWHRPSERYIAICAKCGTEGTKRNMVALYVKDGSYSPLRVLCHICRRCMPEVLDDLEVSMPE